MRKTAHEWLKWLIRKRTVCRGQYDERRDAMDKETVTTTVTLLGTLPGDPPRILTGERLYRNGKPGRLFQQMVPVPDTDLFARLVAQVGAGDMITVTVTTEWYASGYTTHFSDFALPDPAVPAAPEQARV
jgi:hypothetical protein